ncbi:hypothetical protein C5167_017588 [Papaver somniferum]|uniref:Uncharacterized protein n=1 Tax=Papaver somniferum TaxID=3469 RepID=A0A4Y7IN82_PAPSO|nr:hypothetical protein C5167_017588 [Papaver somniferum]
MHGNPLGESKYYPHLGSLLTNHLRFFAFVFSAAGCHGSSDQDHGDRTSSIAHALALHKDNSYLDEPTMEYLKKMKGRDDSE